jgi:hypothetical protein
MNQSLIAAMALLALPGFTRADSIVVFNEVMYHPAASEPSMEWVELHNQQAVDVDISGWSLSNGVEFTFPAGTRIAGRGYMVVAVNPGALTAATPGLTGVLGPFTGRLSNSGEKLELMDNSGRTMDELSYGTDDAWPVSADGTGTSLAKRAPNLGSARPDAWTQSAQVGGTPGAANFPAGGATPPTISLNEVGAAGAGFFLELTNHGATPVVLGGMKIARYSGGTSSFTIPAQSLSPGALVTFTAADLGLTVVEGDRFALRSSDGTQVLDAVSVGLAGRARWGPLGEWKYPTAATPGMVNTFALHTEVVINEIFYHGRPTLPQPAVTQTTTPVVFTSTWKYDQSGTDLGTGWRQPGYSDAAWASGAGLLASGGPTAGYSAEVLADAPRAYWKLDDATTTVADSSGFSRTGTATAGLTLGTAPLVPGDAGAKAMTFTGANRITVPGFEKIGAAGYTVEFWVKILTAPTYFQNLVGDGESASDFFLMNYIGAGNFIRPHYSFGNNPVSIDSVGALAVGQTYHVVTTWDTASTTNNGIIYINGAVNKTGTISRNVPAAGTTGNNKVYIGYDDREVSNGSYVIDEVALYNAPLSAARVAAHYAAGNAPSPRNTTLTNGPPTHYFRNTFNFAGNPANTALSLRLAVDDGAVIYLNGQELYRHNMPQTGIGYATPASNDVTAQSFTGAISVPAAALQNGSNVLAVEVHQSTGNNDVLFGLELTAMETITPAIPFAESEEGWVELYNTGAATVDLTGWKLDNGVDYLFPNGTTLPVGGYLVVAKDPAALLAKFPGILAIGPFNNKLNRGGDKIVLKDPNGNKADSVEFFDGGRWPSAADGGGSSLELRDSHADNSVPEAWAASNESGRSSWQTYTYKATAGADGGPTNWNELALGLLDSGECLIDDVSVVESPATAPVQKIVNGNFSSGASGWRFLGTHGTSAVEPEPGNAGNLVLHLRATGEMEHMHNHIETTYAGGAPITNGKEYEISFRAKMISGSRQLHTRLYHNRCARVTTLAVSAQMGTPGAANSRAVANTGPTFRNLRQSAAIPAATQGVTVSVDVEDPDGVAGASLMYAVNGGGFASAAMTNLSGTWSGSIPGQSGGALVQFYVHATDGLGAEADFPAAGANSRALIVWNDGLANLPLAHNFRVLLTAQDRTTMFTSTNLMSNELLHGTVVYDESEVYHDVGVRLKGSERGRTDSLRISYQVQFDPMQLFRGVQGSVALDRSGNWGYAGQPFGQNEILVKHIIAAAGGVSSQYDDIVRLMVPGTSTTGSALLQMDRYNGDYLDSNYQDGSEGQLYKMELIYYPTSADLNGYKLPTNDGVVGVDISDRSPDKEAYRWFFLHENNTERDEWEAIIALGQAFSKSGAALDAATAPLIAGNEWARCFALQTLCGIGDAYTRGNNHNIYFYQRPKDGRILALPWDWDFAFYQSPNASIFGDQVAWTVLQRPQYLRLYYAHLLDLCNTVYNTSYMSYWTNHYDNFTPGQDFSPLLTYIGNRRTFVLSQLPAQSTLTITNPPANGTLTAATSLALSGTAPWSAGTVELSGPGGVVEVTFSSLGNWSGTMPLLLGTNVVTLTGYDVHGNITGTQSFTVVSSAVSGFVDADADGLPDAWEATHGLDELPYGTAAALDSDHDGLSNAAEYFAGTDPNNPTSVLKLAVSSPAAGQVQLGYPALAGRNYRVTYRDALTGGSWQTLATHPPANSDQLVTVTDTPPAGQGRRFYRLETP